MPPGCELHLVSVAAEASLVDAREVGARHEIEQALGIRQVVLGELVAVVGIFAIAQRLAVLLRERSLDHKRARRIQTTDSRRA